MTTIAMLPRTAVRSRTARRPTSSLAAALHALQNSRQRESMSASAPMVPPATTAWICWARPAWPPCSPGASGDAAAFAPMPRCVRQRSPVRALGLDHEIGSLLPGKSADLCAISLDDPLLAPCYAPESHVIYVCGRENVSHVWVAGQLLLENHPDGFLKRIWKKSHPYGKLGSVRARGWSSFLGFALSAARNG